MEYELHKYTIKNGIYDKKVLPFNVNTIYFKDSLTIFLNLTSPEEISEDKELNKEELIQKVFLGWMKMKKIVWILK
ncbi:hypothetical protein NWE60_06885 [Mycoplasmopsis felis]|nr:hypothetical protein [Mycoplasmopsis felis]WAM01067.1 hypothetical protein NWE60_06885 [Mycoplasmopsis felis]